MYIFIITNIFKSHKSTPLQIQKLSTFKSNLAGELIPEAANKKNRFSSGEKSVFYRDYDKPFSFNNLSKVGLLIPSISAATIFVICLF